METADIAFSDAENAIFDGFEKSGKVEFRTFCSKTGLTPPTLWAVVFNFNDVLYSIGT